MTWPGWLPPGLWITVARENWNYIRVDVLLLENRKVSELTLPSFYLLIGFWLYCGRNLSDGFVPDGVWRGSGRPRDRQMLVDKGLAVKAAGGYHMHDYLEHQRSRAEVEALRRTRAESGAKGGRARAAAVAKSKQVLQQMPGGSSSKTGSKIQADTETDTEKELMAEVSPLSNGHLPVDDAEIEMIIYQIKRRYGRPVTAEWAVKVRAEIMRNAGNIHDRPAYIRKVIESEPDPRRFLPSGRPGYE
jgi:hypothetical protein